MRFMMMVMTDGCSGMPDPRLMAAVGEFSEKMSKAGVLISSGGLLPSASGARIDLTRRNGKVAILGCASFKNSPWRLLGEIKTQFATIDFRLSDGVIV